MELLNQILEYLNNVSPEVWAGVIETIVPALVVSPVALAVKKFFSVDGEKKMVALTIIGSILAAGATFALTRPELSAWVVPIQGMLVFATTQPVYYFFVKPLYKRLAAWFAVEVAKAAKLNAKAPIEAPTMPTAQPGDVVAPTIVDDFHK